MFYENDEQLPMTLARTNRVDLFDRESLRTFLEHRRLDETQRKV